MAINFLFEVLAWVSVLTEFQTVSTHIGKVLQVQDAAQTLLVLVVIYSLVTLAFGFVALNSNLIGQHRIFQAMLVLALIT